jgi:hypothetical protein
MKIEISSLTRLGLEIFLLDFVALFGLGKFRADSFSPSLVPDVGLWKESQRNISQIAPIRRRGVHF